MATKAKPRATRPSPSDSALTRAARARATMASEKARRLAEKEKVAKLKAERRQRRRRTLMWWAALSATVDLGVARGAWTGGKFLVRRTRGAWGLSRRRALSPGWAWLSRRVLSPTREVLSRGRDRLSLWRDDVAAFGFRAHARDCEDCDVRIPGVEWARHRIDDHDDDPAEHAAPPPRGRAFHWHGRQQHDGWVADVPPWVAAAAAARGLFAWARESVQGRRFAHWGFHCSCGWSGTARELRDHIDVCPLNGRRPGPAPIPPPARPVLIPSAREPTPIPVPATDRPGRLFVVPPPKEHTMSSPVIPSSGNAPVAPGADILAGYGDLQIHDVPPILAATVEHFSGEAEIVAAAWDRVRNAENADQTLSDEMGQAFTYLMACKEALERAKQHAEYLASITPDFRQGA